MTTSRLACTLVVFWMLGTTAPAQRRPVVQVAAAIDFATENNAAGAAVPSSPAPSSPVASSPVQFERSKVDTNTWVLTDQSIDDIARQSIAEWEVTGSDLASSDLESGLPIVGEIAQGPCDCGKQHCHGVCRDPGHPKKPLLTKPGDRDRGDCPPLRYRMNDCERAGNPHCYHRWATCSVDDKYSAWFVGGGSPFPFARGRTSSEGTWGLDYGGLFGHAKVWLNYTHGRNQGGTGAYRTDGEPKIISRAHELMHIGH